jgi:hypothetical protein
VNSLPSTHISTRVCSWKNSQWMCKWMSECVLTFSHSSNTTNHFNVVLEERELIFLINNQHTLFHCWVVLSWVESVLYNLSLSLFINSIYSISNHCVFNSIQFTHSIHLSQLWILIDSVSVDCPENRKVCLPTLFSTHSFLTRTRK